MGLFEGGDDLDDGPFIVAGPLVDLLTSLWLSFPRSADKSVFAGRSRNTRSPTLTAMDEKKIVLVGSGTLVYEYVFVLLKCGPKQSIRSEPATYFASSSVAQSPFQMPWKFGRVSSMQLLPKIVTQVGHRVDFTS